MSPAPFRCPIATPSPSRTPSAFDPSSARKVGGSGGGSNVAQLKLEALRKEAGELERGLRGEDPAGM
ncbi:hypothetical protein JCM11641_004858 [Rhodosporidiobolus odoratus]